MTVGFPKTAAEVNARAGQNALTLRDTLVAIRNFKSTMDTLSDVELGAAPYAFSAPDIAVLRSSLVDLRKFAGSFVGFDYSALGITVVNGYAAGEANTATATSATTLTRSGAAWVGNQWAGRVVVAASGVYGNVASNTSTVLTLDQWSNAGTPGGTAGTTPAGTTTYMIVPAYDFTTFAKQLVGFN